MDYRVSIRTLFDLAVAAALVWLYQDHVEVRDRAARMDDLTDSRLDRISKDIRNIQGSVHTHA